MDIRKYIRRLLNRKQKESIFISVVGNVGSGKNHFLYGVFNNLNNIAELTVDDARSLNDNFFSEFSAAHFKTITEQSLIREGIRQTDSVNENTSNKAKITLYVARFKCSKHKVYFLNAPGSYYNQGSNVKSWLDTNIDYDARWKDILRQKALLGQDVSEFNSISNKFQSDIDNLKVFIDGLEEDEQRPLAHEIYFTHIYNANSHFKFVLIDGKEKTQLKLSNLDAQNSLNVISKADLVRLGGSLHFEKKWRYSSTELQKEYTTYFKALMNDSEVFGSKLVLEPVNENFKNILPVLFYVFKISNGEKDNYDSILLDGSKLFKENPDELTLTEDQFSFLKNKALISDDRKNFSTSFVTSNLVHLGFELAVGYMIFSLFNQDVIRHSNDTLTKIIKENIKLAGLDVDYFDDFLNRKRR
jgi:hypothetical protein